MKTKQDLPEIFEQFSEQRRNSFIEALELKRKGIPLIGMFCTYFPEEIATAMDISVVSLCSSSNETILDAEKELPRNLCPLIKSSYGYAVTDKCPHFYFADLIVGETTCDGKKKMYELLGQFKPVYVMELPNTQNPDALILWEKEIIKLKNRLETQFGRTITEDQLKKAVQLKNKERRALKKFYEVMKLDPVPILGQNLYSVLYGEANRFDKETAIQDIYDLTDRIYEDYKKEKPYPKAPRILVTGCPINGVAQKVVRSIEENNGHVVAFENCGGAKAIDKLVEEDSGDIYKALAKRYLDIGCSVMTPNPNRLDLLERLIEEYHVDAVVEVTLQACHTYNVESLTIKRFTQNKMNLPYLGIETDYSTSDIGQLDTRIAAFIEMLL